jgi:hypothetical protein
VTSYVLSTVEITRDAEELAGLQGFTRQPTEAAEDVRTGEPRPRPRSDETGPRVTDWVPAD